MNTNDQELVTLNDTEETVNEVEIESAFEEESVEDLKKKLATADAQKEHWKKKALETKESKEPKVEVKQETNQNGLSQKDLFALVKADVHEDDIDEVAEYAQLKKISIAEALKSTVVKSILSEKAEFRKTAEMTNTAPARKGNSKVSDDTLLSKLAKGEVPESQTDAEQLFWARRGGKR